MSLALLLQALPTTVARHEAWYRRERVSEPAFAPYSTAGALLEALSTTSTLPTRERQSIVTALVLRHQPTRHPLWQALLLKAFEPMLLALRARDRGSKADREQRVLLAFLEALARVPVEGQPAFLAVRRATARALFEAVRAEVVPADVEPFEEAGPACAPRPHVDPEPFVVCLAHEVLSRLARHRGGLQLARVLAGLETRAEQNRRLSGPDVDDAHAGLTTSCWRRRRANALTKVRAELARGRKGGRP